MSDFLRDFLDEVGNTALGLPYRAFRAQVHAWLDANPLVVRRWRQAIRDAVQEGRL